MAQLTGATGNGDWWMGNAECGLGGGEWRMENEEWRMEDGSGFGSGMPLDIWNFDWWLPSQPASALWLYLTIDCRCHKNAKKEGLQSRAYANQDMPHTSPLPYPSRLSLSKLVVRGSIYCLLLFLLYFHSLLRKVVVGNNNTTQHTQKIATTFCLPLFGSPALAAVATLATLAHLQQPSWFLHISDSASISLQWAGT